MKKDRSQQTAQEHSDCILSRRKFLLYSSATAAATSVISLNLFPGTAQAKEMKAQVTAYPRIKVAKMSELKLNQPFDFQYPDKGPNSQAMLVKTGVKSGGGIGKEQDIVAFSYICTHQGGPLIGQYKVVDEHRVLGQCPFHLSTFDLRRHGIIVSGQAYESLPQVLLEVDGDDIYAVGIMGLLFGRTDNKIAG